MTTHENAARAWRDLEFAADAVGALAVANISLPIEVARALVAERRAISALTPPDVARLVEKTARAWASIDGKAVRFDDDKADRLGDRDGTFEGYMSEARELMKRSGLLSTLTHLAAENALLREREGWKLVPVESTWEMQIAGRDALLDTPDDDSLDLSTDDAGAVYAAMLAASPSHQEQNND